MVIYGVALLAACLLAGLYLGELLGQLLGVQANVGGVGIAMLMLVLAGGSSRLQSLVIGASGEGVKFWSAMYIPIVVAMAVAWQHVYPLHLCWALEAGQTLTREIDDVLFSHRCIWCLHNNC